jgi:hypothetical protein
MNVQQREKGKNSWSEGNFKIEDKYDKFHIFIMKIFNTKNIWKENRTLFETVNSIRR